ncbi:hypothetical protein [Bacteroides pyogenes]|uniref:Toxin-antitoxin system protein n=1 Tax=Bacteroides pyogenes TaxID=310300 RepID=A0A5D3E9H3_9BACE|nr:hypothetical protein [Bacteroides pyogenes]TYK32807.1 hypothetical protein FNJ60_10375 [Bacteroides pyogenes]
MRTIRKQIDIPEDDFVALQILAARKHTSLKKCIEQFLHQVAEMAIKNEIEIRFDKMRISSSFEKEGK